MPAKKEKPLEPSFVQSVKIMQTREMTFRQIAEDRFPYQLDRNLSALMKGFPGFLPDDSCKPVGTEVLARAVAELAAP
jgi:hypothetical protein